MRGLKVCLSQQIAWFCNNFVYTDPGNQRIDYSVSILVPRASSIRPGDLFANGAIVGTWLAPSRLAATSFGPYTTAHMKGSFRWFLAVELLALIAAPLAGQQTREPTGTAVVQAVTPEGPLAAREIDSFIAPLFSGYRRPQARYAVDVFELRITTRYPNGRITPVRVQVFVPQADEPAVGGIYLFAPGSTGIVGPCRASREHVAGIRWGLYRAHVLAFAGQGFIGILPDYMGYEDPQLVQPYFHAASEARVVFDSLHGVDDWIRTEYSERFPEGISAMQRVAAGFSQGGHAAFAAADRNTEMGGALYLHGVIGYGPTTQVEPMLQMYPSLAPMLAMSYYTVYGRSSFDPYEVLQDRWAESLEYDTTRQCVGAMQSYYPSDPYDVFETDFIDSMRDQRLGITHPVIHRVFRANETGLARHRVPALILQGTDDIVVSQKTQANFVEALRARGNPVDYRLYEGSRHDTRQVAFFEVAEWIRTLDPDFRPPQLGGPRRYDPAVD